MGRYFWLQCADMDASIHATDTTLPAHMGFVTQKPTEVPNYMRTICFDRRALLEKLLALGCHEPQHALVKSDTLALKLLDTRPAPTLSLFWMLHGIKAPQSIIDITVFNLELTGFSANFQELNSMGRTRCAAIPPHAMPN